MVAKPPQTTNEHKPQRHQRHTTRHHTTSHHSKPKPPHADATAQPSNHSGGFATIDPRHAGDTPQRSAYGSNSPPNHLRATIHEVPSIMEDESTYVVVCTRIK